MYFVEILYLIHILNTLHLGINVDNLLLLCLATAISGSSYGQTDEKMAYKEYLSEGAPTKKEIDVFLNELSWARFDPELGYILGNSLAVLRYRKTV